jgi:hypothetical protein
MKKYTTYQGKQYPQGTKTPKGEGMYFSFLNEKEGL